MLFLSPEADYVRGLFLRCHARTVVGFGGVLWQRIALPEPGGVADQDAWLMAALEYMRDVMNRLELDLAKDAERKRKKTSRTE